ncbi:hypothetical protein Y032_0286g1373 [Ancylostoma ceylanicum]|uniref:Uncharacterized protein n=1 Tax=Ancylostoma ceylanicum TaxID=53326 RepID=A0A016S6Q2_9BILA|nr:hypothetical protein Y032_0286g1373 [Ancylostoma ceylanicum]
MSSGALPPRNFSSIARRVLIRQQTRSGPETGNPSTPHCDTADTILFKQESEDSKAHLEQAPNPVQQGVGTCSFTRNNPNRRTSPEQTISSIPQSSGCSSSLEVGNDVKPTSQQVKTSSMPECTSSFFTPQGGINRKKFSTAVDPSLPVDVVDGVYTQYNLCRCDLCKRIYSLTEERLTAPLEGPYEPSTPYTVRGRPALGARARLLVKNVRMFFEELRRQMEFSCRGTILNCPRTMASLACGVSRRTITYTACPKSIAKRGQNGGKQCPPRQKSAMKLYGKKWGVTVRNFIKYEMKLNKETKIDELHTKICSTFADFPNMTPKTFAFFTRALGFHYMMVGNKRCIVYRPPVEDSEVDEAKSEDV